MSVLQLPSLWAETKEHSRALWARPNDHARDWTVLFVGLLAIFLDGATTYAMIHLPQFSEVNPAALATMNILGVEAYILLAASGSLAFTAFWLVRGPGLLGKVLPVFALFFITLKFGVGAQNLALWAVMSPWAIF